MIFETERLYARKLEQSDEPGFYQLMSNPRVVAPIPQDPMNRAESDSKLRELISLEKSGDTKIWAWCEKGTRQFIGIGGLTKNNENTDEIAYRILEEFWGKGYGTEIAKGLINFCFSTLNPELIAADVNIENTRSLKILEKFFTVQKDFYNADDHCTDRRFILRRENWMQKTL